MFEIRINGVTVYYCDSEKHLLDAYQKSDQRLPVSVYQNGSPRRDLMLREAGRTINETARVS